MTQKNPVREGNIIRGRDFRFSLLTTRLIRVEYDRTGRFEDRPTRLVQNREFPPVEFTWEAGEDTLRIETPHLTLYYEGGPFTGHSLRIDLKARGHVHGSRWHFGQELSTLKGTCRTLDEANGPVPLEEGLASRNGYSYLDDSSSPVTEGGIPAPRDREGAVDGYFFGYARDFFALSRDFFLLSGPTPRLPRYALGNWWSRYWPYSQEEYLALMDRFEREGLPFSVCVIDMDWHLVEVEERFGGGWTGYTWNRKLFPDPRGFLGELHRRGYRVTLNLHPASGVRSYEEPYEAMARALGEDPSEGRTIPLRPESPGFMEAYFRCLHHPLEEQGVDFWWIDWQQGSLTAREGMDPLWLLNHHHTRDRVRGGGDPLILSRYAGPGSHRYPVGFSGDTVTSWESLDFQVYFTSTAANMGYNWWSHDIGGHMHGSRDGELSVRWLQFGVFSPINRLHSSRSLFHVKEPWHFPRREREIMNRYLRIRHRLIPYLYSLNVRLAEEGRPFLTPLYYHHPEEEESYSSPRQYYFGDNLMVRALTAPMDRTLDRSEADVWLPGGLWFDFFTGRSYGGEGRILMYRSLEEQLVLARGGAVLPLEGEEPGSLEWLLFPGGDGSFELVEKGEGGDGRTVLENLLHSRGLIRLNPAGGDGDAVPRNREVSFCLRGVEEPDEIVLEGASGRRALSFSYEEERASVRFSLPEYRPDETYVIRCIAAPYGNGRWREDAFDLLMGAEIPFGDKEAIYALCRSGKKKGEILAGLTAMKLSPSLFGALCEIIGY